MNLDYLFETSGAGAQRGIRRVNAAAVVVLAAVVFGLYLALQTSGQLAWARWEPLVNLGAQQFILTGVVNTLRAGAVAIVASMVLGALLAFARLNRRKSISLPAAVVTEVLRALPLLFVVYFFLLAMPGLGVRLPPFWQLVCAIVLHGAGVFAELFRAGVKSIPRGQAEAAASLGLSGRQTMKAVLLPQVVRALLPAMIGQSVFILKETTLGYVVSYPELLRRGQTLAEFLNESFLQVFFEVAIIFILINATLSYIATVLERRQSGAGARSLTGPASGRQWRRARVRAGLS